MNAPKSSAFILAFLSGVFHFFLSFPVFETGPDALAQIIGAYNFYIGNGYVLSSGESVRFWPPLYSIYASLFLHIDNSFVSLAIANAILISCVSLSWSFFILSSCELLTKRQNAPRGPGVSNILIISGATLVIVHVLRHPSSEAMFALTFPFYLHFLLKLSLCARSPSAVSTLKPLLASIILVNSHNIGVILLLSTCLPYFVVFIAQNQRGRLAVFAVSCAAALVSWIAMRKVFHLEGSHEFAGLFGAERSAYSAAFDLIYGPSDLIFFIWPLGASIIAVVIYFCTLNMSNAPRAQRNAAYALLASILIFDLLLFIMFTSITIYSGIGGRFALFQTLLVLTFGALIMHQIDKKSYFFALAFACLPILSGGARVAKWYKEYHFDEVYQWNRSVVLSRESLDHKAIQALRRSRCPDLFCATQEKLGN